MRRSLKASRYKDKSQRGATGGTTPFRQIIASGIPVHWLILFSQPLDTGSTTHVLQLILLLKQDYFGVQGEIRAYKVFYGGTTRAEIVIQWSEHERHLAFPHFLAHGLFIGAFLFRMPIGSACTMMHELAGVLCCLFKRYFCLETTPTFLPLSL